MTCVSRDAYAADPEERFKRDVRNLETVTALRFHATGEAIQCSGECVPLIEAERCYLDGAGHEEESPPCLAHFPFEGGAGVSSQRPTAEQCSASENQRARQMRSGLDQNASVSEFALAFELRRIGGVRDSSRVIWGNRQGLTHGRNPGLFSERAFSSMA